MWEIVFDGIKVDLILDLFKARDKLCDILDVKQDFFDHFPSELLDLGELFDVKFIVPDSLYWLAAVILMLSSLIELGELIILWLANWRVLRQLGKLWIMIR